MLQRLRAIPQHARIGRFHPLARGLEYACFYDQSGGDTPRERTGRHGGFAHTLSGMDPSTDWVVKKGVKCLHLGSGDDEYIHIPGAILNGATSFTVHMRMMHDSGSHSMSFFSACDATGNNEVVAFYISATSLRFYIANVFNAQSTPNFRGDGLWHDWQLIWRSSDGLCRVYVDGIKVWDRVVSSGATLDVHANGCLIGQEIDSMSGSPLLPGGFSSTQKFKGYVSECLIWRNHFLMPSQLKDLYGLFQPRAVLGRVPAGTLFFQVVAGSQSFSGVVTKSPEKLLAGDLTSGGGLTKQAVKGFAGTLTSDGSIIKRAGKVIAGTLSSSGNLGTIRLFVKVLSGILSSSGALVKRTSKPLAGAFTSAGALVKSTAHSFVGALTSDGALTKRANKGFAGTLSSSGSLGTIRLFVKTIAGTLTSSGNLGRKTLKALVGSLTSSGVLVKKTAVSLSGSLTSSGVVAAVITAIGNVVLTLRNRSTALTVFARSNALTVKARSVVLSLLNRD